MLMAAGQGTRLRPFTERLPKPFLPLMGIPIIQFPIDRLVAAQVSTIAVNLHHLAERGRDELKKVESKQAKIEVSDESLELLGSAGGIRKALPILGNQAFYYVNSDVLSDLDLKLLASRHAELRKKHQVLL